MSGEQKKRFDQTVGARNAVSDLAGAYSELGITGKESMLEAVGKRSQMANVPFRGDTPYTQALTRFEEYLGRLQSGGMIGSEEAARFRKMVPTSYDVSTSRATNTGGQHVTQSRATDCPSR